MSSYALANVRGITIEKKANSHEGITWSEIGKQNLQAKKVDCTSDGVVETTKTSLRCSRAVDQSVSWISRANSVPLGILLSRIHRK